MIKICKRIELLEEVLLPVEQGPPQIIRINFVDADSTVVNTRSIEIPSVPPARRNRGWRTS